MDSGPSLRLLAARPPAVNRVRPPTEAGRGAAAAAIGTVPHPAPTNRAATDRRALDCRALDRRALDRRAATVADRPRDRPVRNWICGSPSCGLRPTVDRAADTEATTALPATVGRTVRPATAVRMVPRDAVRPATVVVIAAPPAAVTPPADIPLVVDTPAAAAEEVTLEVAGIPVAAATPAVGIAKGWRCCQQLLYAGCKLSERSGKLM